MNRLLASIFVLSFSLTAAEQLKHGPDSEYHDGVPKGKIEKQTPWQSKIFPGTVRDWWIYVPAQYNPAKPANVMVFQDGGGPVSDKGEMRAPVVFDNLINKKEMPVTIGIFINPGVLPPSEPVEIKDADGKVIGKKLPRMNRAFEYDSVGDRYARFLLEEILLEVEKKYNLTKDPAGRAVCGQSSGGSCAFTVAWERPDAFGKVVSGIGSFTSLHGCNAYPDLIRKTEPKAIRIYMQDGDHDLDIYAGSWWHANQDMAAAFNWMGYDYFFLQGHDGHSGKQLGMNFPDAMRWLWRTDPVEGKRPEKVDPRGVWEVLIKGEGWKKVYDSGMAMLFGPAADDAGAVFFPSIRHRQEKEFAIKKISADSQISDFVVYEKSVDGMIGLQFGPDGKLYGHNRTKKQVLTIDVDGKANVIAEACYSDGLAINFNGDIYGLKTEHGGSFALMKNKERKTLNIEQLGNCIFTPDQGFLISFNGGDSKLKSYRVETNGELAQEEPFYTLQSLEGQLFSNAFGAAADDKGRLYVSSVNGIQIFDQGGRVIGILTLPERNEIQGICFGGPNFDTLFAVTVKGVFTRKLNARGVRSCKPPVIPPKPQM